MAEEIVSRTQKTVIHWGSGLAVFITTEAKKLGWKAKDKINVTLTKDGKITVTKN